MCEWSGPEALSPGLTLNFDGVGLWQAGLVKAAGLERQLIVRNEEDYEQVVLALCRNAKVLISVPHVFP